MAKNRQLVESQSESGSREIDLQESDSESDQRTSSHEKFRSNAGPTEAREDGEIKADDTCAMKKSNDDSKKLLFQRIWSEDDEIAILKGLTEYSSKKKSDPMANLSAFHDFIKKNLQVDVTRTQLQHKIRRLKKKYQNNKNKAKDGKERTFSKSHEQKAYDISKTVWENDVCKNKGNGRKASEQERGESSLSKRSRMILRGGAELFEEGGEGFEGQKEWKKLRMDELELHCKHLELKLAQSRLVLDVLKSNYPSLMNY